MKTFYIKGHGDITPLRVHHSPFPHVRVGDDGRGRKLVRLPLGRRDWPGCEKCGGTYFITHCDGICPPLLRKECEENNLQGKCRHTTTCECVAQIERASLIRTKEKGTLLLVKETRPDDRALVIVGIYGGYRGFSIHDILTPDLVTQVEGLKGWEAEGDAGRMGTSVHVGYIFKPGGRVNVHRRGRLYGAPQDLVVTYDGEEVYVRSKEDLTAEDAGMCSTDGEEL